MSLNGRCLCVPSCLDWYNFVLNIVRITIYNGPAMCDTNDADIYVNWSFNLDHKYTIMSQDCFKITYLVTIKLI